MIPTSGPTTLERRAVNVVFGASTMDVSGKGAEVEAKENSFANVIDW